MLNKPEKEQIENCPNLDKIYNKFNFRMNEVTKNCTAEMHQIKPLIAQCDDLSDSLFEIHRNPNPTREDMRKSGEIKMLIGKNCYYPHLDENDRIDHVSVKLDMMEDRCKSQKNQIKDDYDKEILQARTTCRQTLAAEHRTQPSSESPFISRVTQQLYTFGCSVIKTTGIEFCRQIVTYVLASYGYSKRTINLVNQALTCTLFLLNGDNILLAVAQSCIRNILSWAGISEDHINLVDDVFWGIRTANVYTSASTAVNFFFNLGTSVAGSYCGYNCGYKLAQCLWNKTPLAKKRLEFEAAKINYNNFVHYYQSDIKEPPTDSEKQVDFHNLLDQFEIEYIDSNEIVVCPISRCIISDPVKVEGEKHIYERNQLKRCKTSPMTRANIRDKPLITDADTKRAFQKNLNFVKSEIRKIEKEWKHQHQDQTEVKRMKML